MGSNAMIRGGCVWLVSIWLGLALHGAASAVGQDTVVTLDDESRGQQPGGQPHVTSGVLSTSPTEVTNATGCDPASMGPAEGQIEFTEMPFRLALHSPGLRTETGQFWCVSANGDALHTSPCFASSNVQERDNLVFTLSSKGLLQLHHNAGPSQGCANRQGCVIASEEGALHLGGCADAVAAGAKVLWQLRHQQLVSIDSDGKCLVAEKSVDGPPQLKLGDCDSDDIAQAKPPALRTVDGKVGQLVQKGQRCASACFERTGARWEDEISMPDGWCMVRVPTSGDSSAIQWGTCSSVGTEPPLGEAIDPNQCALYEQQPAAPFTPSAGSLAADLKNQLALSANRTMGGNDTLNNNSTPEQSASPVEKSAEPELRESGSSDKGHLPELVEGWAALPALGRQLLSEEEPAGAKHEQQLRTMVGQIQVKLRAERQGCTAANTAVKDALEKTKMAYKRAEADVSTSQDLEERRLQAAEESAGALHTAEAAVKDWCGGQSDTQAQLNQIQVELAKATETNERLQRQQRSLEASPSIPRSFQKKAETKIAAAVTQLRKAKSDATRASRALSRSYKQVVNAAQSSDYDRLIKMRNRVETAKTMLLSAHQTQHAAYETISQQQSTLKRLKPPKSPPSILNPNVEQAHSQSVVGSQVQEGAKGQAVVPVMPTNSQLLEAAAANGIMSNDAAAGELSDGGSRWQFLQESAVTIGHGCKRHCVQQTNSTLRQCIKQCNGYESGQAVDGNTINSWRATCKVMQVSECTNGKCQVSHQSECVQLEVGSTQQMRIVTSSHTPCPGFGDQTSFCTDW